MDLKLLVQEVLTQQIADGKIRLEARDDRVDQLSRELEESQARLSELAQELDKKISKMLDDHAAKNEQFAAFRQSIEAQVINSENKVLSQFEATLRQLQIIYGGANES